MQERFATRFAEFEDFNRTCDRRKVNVTRFGSTTCQMGATGFESNHRDVGAVLARHLFRIATFDSR
jgi:hypothetical protein